MSVEEAEDLFRRTVEFWQRWIAQSRYTGRWREMVHRSALALKLLTYEPTGAIVAAPTCSLPEGIGGKRNWDYRYTWIRDSAFTIYAFLRLGFSEETEQFMRFLASLCKEPGPGGSLQIMYGIDGRKHLIEETLNHLDGYMGSRPVPTGSQACRRGGLEVMDRLMSELFTESHHFAAACAMAVRLNVLIPASSRTLRR